MKIHHHIDQLDGNRYAHCGRVPANSPSIVLTDEFEATEPQIRCKVCERDWFPFGQPDWHLRHARTKFGAKK